MDDGLGPLEGRCGLVVDLYEVLDLLNEIVAQNPGRDIHVVLDNLNTHKPKRDRCLKLHPLVQFHYTPTYSSWLNQVECWFSILQRRALSGASFTSPEQVRRAIDNNSRRLRRL